MDFEKAYLNLIKIFAEQEDVIIETKIERRVKTNEKDKNNNTDNID